MKLKTLSTHAIVFVLAIVLGFVISISVRPDNDALLQAVMLHSGQWMNETVERGEPRLAVSALRQHLETIDIVRNAGWPSPYILNMQEMGTHASCRFAKAFESDCHEKGHLEMWARFT